MRRTSLWVGLSFILTSSASAQVSGTVVDDGTGAPIAGAIVSLQASNIETTTDEAGAFELADANGGGLVIVAGAKG